MGNLYQYIRWLSLDIVLGAIFFLSFLEKFYSVQLNGSVYFALASAVWLIYTADHLIDSKKVIDPTSGRHRFHQKYHTSILFVGGIVLILALLNVYNLPEEIVQVGALLSAGCVGYLMLVFFFKKLWVKEVLVALVYASGIFLAPIVTKGELLLSDSIYFLQLVLIAFLNLLIFSFYDFEGDTRDGFNSLVLRMGKNQSSLLLHGLSIISFAIATCLAVFYASDIQVMYLLMSALLYSLHLFPTFYRTDERFRTVGDGVFYLPALFLLLYL